MGFMKGIKDMKKAVAAAPDLVSGAMQMKEQAEQMVAAQQAASVQAAAQEQRAADAASGGAEYEPIAGVSLEQFAQICKGLAAHAYDQSKAPEVAAAHGVSAEAWQQALDGWNEQIKTNGALAQRFNKLYMAG